MDEEQCTCQHGCPDEPVPHPAHKPTYEERLAKIRHKLQHVDVAELDAELRRMRDR